VLACGAREIGAAARTGHLKLDVPDIVRNYALAEGYSVWLDELPNLVQSLAEDWSLTIGPTLHGGHAAFVAEATTSEGTRAVLKVGVPGNRSELRCEAAVLRLANGDCCAQVLGDDLDRDALLLERLGPAMYEVVADTTIRHDLLCDLATRLWRPVGSEIDLPTGADRAHSYGELLPRLWQLTGRPCLQATIDDAIACAERRRHAHDDRLAVLVHGDIHDANALVAADGTFKLIDPDGLRAEPASDLGTILRANPDTGDDLRARAERLARRTGVDVTAIWEWGTIYRVIGGLHSRRVGFQPFGDQLLAHADQLTTG
jgi:streptomycin 6-kinase